MNLDQDTAHRNCDCPLPVSYLAGMEELTVLEGLAAVKGALLGGRRAIESVMVDRKRDDRGTEWLKRAARERGVRVRMLDRAELDGLADGSSHGGVLARVGPPGYCALEELLPESGSPFVVMLDGIEDPYNYAFAVRTLWAAGADGLVVRPRDWSNAAALVARSSAGASELIPTAVADTPDDAADLFRSRGLAVAVTAKEKESRSLYETDLTVPLFLLIGGERRGVRRSFLDKADLLLSIPYGRDFRQSLGAASAAGIIGFKVMRQRSLGAGEE